MKVTKSLPTPEADASAHSQQLQEHICREIESNNGSISFRRYMEMALYEPGLGYYVAGQKKLGEDGDFITAPEISALFSQCVANQCAQVLNQLGGGSIGGNSGGNILEFGAGSGTMAVDILLQLESLEQLPDSYYILDLSPDLKELQKNTIESCAPHLLSRVQWLSSLPDKPFRGVILANEVLDAMPVELFTKKDSAIYQNHVGWQDNQFKLLEITGDDQFSHTVNRLYIDDIDAGESEGNNEFRSEFNPTLDAWVEQIAQTLEQGVVLLIDYGYTRQEYYHPDRNDGTLICHYKHLVHNEFFWYPGLQDITANVDFTHVAEAADKNGLTISGFTSQAAFLASCGLESVFMQALTHSPDDQYSLAQQVRTLSLPAEMGERFKVIALSKAIDFELIGFSVIDYRHKL